MARPRGVTLTYRLYAAVANVLAPLAYRKVARKLFEAGVAQQRLRERIGHATLPRPEGFLVWCHAASVGESLSALTLIRRLGEARPDLQFLLTSGTATSAEIVSKRLPPRCRHQFAPLDGRRILNRFLGHWRPDMAIFVESELWPQMLVRTRATGIPLALLNARLSQGSLRSWGRIPQTARFILSRFSLIRTQDAETLQGLLGLGADPHTTTQGPNLKAAAAPLPVDDDVLSGLRRAIGSRPVWVAASTHPGEEDIVLQAHEQLLKAHPDLLLILVPRHPERVGEIEALIRARGLSQTRRSTGGTAQAEIYLADTLGELGLWYALAPVVFVGGSLVPVGGHNPFEPAQAGAVVLHGPLYANFAESYAAFAQIGGQAEVKDATALANAVGGLLDDPARLSEAGQQAKTFAETQMQGLDATVQDLSALVQPV
ncbi:3-deoxy-D-manno-octulosonic acid transferase [Thalassovita sp.]|uniref:3-deoxy-D-manno-octulosonic acid transferase n=1 Tax=Thalassovita sp. TaxID=1979401 RepID=UPI002B26AC75|nr:3-deoxy-D-manno-octulosonic acid transferase [Thalassovita sp.]